MTTLERVTHISLIALSVVAIGLLLEQRLRPKEHSAPLLGPLLRSYSGNTGA